MGTLIKRVNPLGTVLFRAQIRVKKAGYPDFSESKTFSKKSMAVEWIKKREADIDQHPDILLGQKKNQYQRFMMRPGIYQRGGGNGAV